jgi:hypothetical protein
MSEEVAVNLNEQERLKLFKVFHELTEELLEGRLSAFQLEFDPPIIVSDYEFDGLVKGYQKVGLLVGYSYDVRYYKYISCEAKGNAAGKRHKVERVIEVAHRGSYNDAGYHYYRILKIHGFTYDAGERCEDKGD